MSKDQSGPTIQALTRTGPCDCCREDASVSTVEYPEDMHIESPTRGRGLRII